MALKILRVGESKRIVGFWPGERVGGGARVFWVSLDWSLVAGRRKRREIDRRIRVGIEVSRPRVRMALALKLFGSEEVVVVTSD